MIDKKMLLFENEAYDNAYLCVAGVDEVGRGPLAGPVVAAAVYLPRSVELPDLDDSKKLTRKKRENFDQLIRKIPKVLIAISQIEADEVDKINILRATHKAMSLATSQISPPVDFLLIDGLPVKSISIPNKNIVKGDSKSASIAAASIVAKVFRDKIMMEAGKLYPVYDFCNNMGYGTAKHLDALKKYGPSPIHRISFAPVAASLPGALKQGVFDF